MHRRHFMVGVAGALAWPSIARAADRQVIKFVPAADVPSLDPVWTSASQTRDHAMMVYDTL
jgi:peptide/nickel transport system substrate-binding protein